MNRFARLLSRSTKVVNKRGYHEGPHNPGPPITLDYMPVPQHPYKVVYRELQNRFNIFLGVSLTLLFSSIGLAIYNDTFQKIAWTPPDSYRYRNKK